MRLHQILVAGPCAVLTWGACVSHPSGGTPAAASPSATATSTAAVEGQLQPRVSSATDPGPRAGPPGGGGPLAGLNSHELALFNEGLFRATELEATCDTCSDVPAGTVIPPGSPPDTTNSAGLGARFNSDQCLSCHSQPAFGGTSPAVNPSFAAAGHKGALNVVPAFETLDGPTREVRFRFNPDGTRDGSVHRKFTVTGRSDAPNCTIQQPNFDAEAARDNLAFRIPTPLFGLGLIDSIPDTEIRRNMALDAERKAELGIHGVTNNSPNDGTISRFGWKAQNKSIVQFAGEAYNVEMGVTNELNPQAMDEDANCNLGAEPNDVTRSDAQTDTNSLELMPDWMMFSVFMRFLDAPTPAELTPAAAHGKHLFSDIGCAACHTPSMQTKDGPQGPQSPALKGKTVNLFSDLLLHHMGGRLADNIIQGNAGPDMFRTAPLWGVGQRLFFLHDGRARDLNTAIYAHFSRATEGHGKSPDYVKSEANQTVRNYDALRDSERQDVLTFLRTL